jgi:uncharacterized protein YgiM (DUF1202 family)
MQSSHRDQAISGVAGRGGDPRAAQQPGPGKVTLTSMLPVQGAAAPVVQRQQAVAQPQTAAPAGEQAQGDNDPLQVERGQLTFDAEGTEGGRFHSRRAHWPGGASGVTIGRGYDLGQQSAAGIQADLVQAGISAADAGRFAGAAGITGTAARDWLRANGQTLSEVTLEQQEALFEIAYARLAGDVERISGNYAGTMGTRTGRGREEFEIDWTQLHPAIRDVLVDLRYRGDYTPTTRQRVQPPAIANDLRALHEVMSDRAYWVEQRHVPEDRFNRRVRFLADALGTPQQQGAPGQAPADAGEAAQPAAPAEARTAAPPMAGAPAGGERDGAAPQPAEAEASTAAPPQAGAAEQPGQAAAPQAGTPATFTVTATSLNVRSGPDASSRRLGGLQRGERITGTPNGSGWVQITFQGQPAFVSVQHVTAGAGQTSQPQPEPQQPQAAANVQRSGANWVSIATASGWTNSTEFSALDPSWGPRAEAFVTGLRAAGAQVHITAGLRHPNRAFLMHYAWGVAHGQYTPAQGNAACRGRGINIEWDHGNAAASRAAAQALVNAFGLVHQASITSNHVHGLAIDMEISGLPASITMNGQTYTTRRGASGAAAAESVVPIGRGMGVIWFGAGDRVHWSHNGR